MVSAIEVPEDVIRVKDLQCGAVTFATQETHDRIQLSASVRIKRLKFRDAARKEQFSGKNLMLELARQTDQQEFTHSMLADLARQENALLEAQEEGQESLERQKQGRQNVKERKSEVTQYLSYCS